MWYYLAGVATGIFLTILTGLLIASRYEDEDEDEDGDSEENWA